MFYYIYRLDLTAVIAVIAVSVPLWAGVMRLLSGINPRAVRAVNAVLAAVSLAGIVYATLIRSPSHTREIFLMPFHSFIEAKAQKEMYREMLMNVFLFTPLGLTAPFALAKTSALERTGEKRLKSVLVTVLFALAFAVIIEAAQFVFATGRCETDDVLCNTLGAAVGALAFIIATFHRRHAEK
ncbi:MAG: VanZ family protein [Clostridia bacterium]|nr:VanZ family protein [Clostridia bacterium]